MRRRSAVFLNSHLGLGCLLQVASQTFDQASWRDSSQRVLYYYNLMSAESSVIVRPAGDVQGLVRIPGDKSISHRYAMLAAIAGGTSRFHNFSAARDCASTLGCVVALGAQSRHAKDGAVEVTGVGAALDAPSGL